MRIKRLGIKGKVATVFAAMGVLLILSVAYITYTASYERVAAEYTGIAASSAQMAAALVDGDDIQRYLNSGPDDSYTRANEALRSLKEAYRPEYLYIIIPDLERNEGAYVFDVYSSGNNDALIASLGEPTGEMDVYDIVRETYLTGSSTRNAIITDSKFGYLASAYAPVYGSGGSIHAVAGADISMDAILNDVRDQTLQIAGAALLVILLFLIVLLYSIHRRVLDPIVRLSKHMERFTPEAEGGEFAHVTVTNSGDELQATSEAFNRMADDLRLYVKNLAAITSEKERIGAELSVATRIQSGMLPSIFPAFPERAEFDLYAAMQPAKEVGGDFYDLFLIDANTLAVVIADVSGKGVPAALFMVITKTLIKNNAQNGKSPKEVFETVNNLLMENNDAAMFVTAILGYLDIPSGRFTFVNAGHNPPLKRARPNEPFDWLKVKPGFVLAGFRDMFYKQHEITLEPGGELFLYTDGVTEAMNSENELFGNARLLNSANAYPENPLKEFTVSIRRDIDKFAWGAQQADDLTMLILRYKGSI